MKLQMLSGPLGTGIVVGGYIYQVAQLVRTHRAEGVSGPTSFGRLRPGYSWYMPWGWSR